jgi:quercetin dioxygenase-like cupin family protein
MLGATSLLAAKPLRALTVSPDRTTVSADGITRTTLESYLNDAGEDFRLVLTTYPPGVGLPVHHHPSAAHNYILEGIAESQYAGEELMHFTAGQSYQDKASVKHLVFRNPDRTAPLKYLIAYTIKAGQSYLIIP